MLKILGIDFKRINKNIVPCITHYVYVNFHYFELNTFLYKIIYSLQTNYNNAAYSALHIKAHFT